MLKWIGVLRMRSWISLARVLNLLRYFNCFNLQTTALPTDLCKCFTGATYLSKTKGHTQIVCLHWTLHNGLGIVGLSKWPQFWGPNFCCYSTLFPLVPKCLPCCITGRGAWQISGLRRSNPQRLNPFRRATSNPPTCAKRSDTPHPPCKLACVCFSNIHTFWWPWCTL